MIRRWKKSSFSGEKGDCVEVCPVPGGMAVRDSKLGEDGPILSFTPAEWDAFLAGVRAGEFDDMA